ncbi:MAG: hypothetical protein M3Y18_03375 [Candidatus Eremiobacteraeota bacterium]|nr:hypothetical protein [Candidatus Eremiobacteraeota bacterium]
MTWSIAGLLVAALLAGVAWSRSGARSDTPFERDLYAMTAPVHRRYAATGAVFFVLFAISLRIPGAAVPLLAALVTVAIFYAASFARGYTGEDE